MPLRSDIWRIGIAQAPFGRVAAEGLDAQAVVWLPETPRMTFLADPFGLARDGRRWLFCEAYDYRTRQGVIDVLELDALLGVAARRTVLREGWHLSYPFVFEAEGVVWMSPEAHRSGVLTLYRAAQFPDRWEAVTRLALDTPAIDPTVFRHGGLWWLAYAPSGPQSAKQGRLHLAWAQRLDGPWTPHRDNPVRIDLSSSRPGGTPFVREDGVLVLPVQDCSRTYGGGLRTLEVVELSPERFEAKVGASISPPASVGLYRDGLHSLSAMGDLTLFDVKRIDRSPAGLGLEIARLFAR